MQGSERKWKRSGRMKLAACSGREIFYECIENTILKIIKITTTIITIKVIILIA